MSMMEYIVRPVTSGDADRIAEIYSYYVRKTAITFEYDPPTAEETIARIAQTTKRYPFLVLEEDGVVQGFTYAGVLKDRAAYDYSCEVTIYLDRHAAGRGYARALYEVLEMRLWEMGIVNLYACIGFPSEKDDEYLSRNSAQFHAHMGYMMVGRFHECGYKFGRWYDVIWMEKIIGQHREDHREAYGYVGG